MSDEFFTKLTYGQEIQDFLINYVERHFGAKFIAGDRYGQIVNTDVLEEMNRCSYRPSGIDEHGRWHGPQLLLKDKNNSIGDWVTMPDEFMYAETRKRFFWAEVKGSPNPNNVELNIPIKDFTSYLDVGKYTGYDVWVFACFYSNPFDENNYDILYSTVRKMDKKKNKSRFSGNYSWKIYRDFTMLAKNVYFWEYYPRK